MSSLFLRARPPPLCPSADALSLKYPLLPFVLNPSSKLPPLGSLWCHLALWNLSDSHYLRVKPKSPTRFPAVTSPPPSSSSSISLSQAHPLGHPLQTQPIPSLCFPQAALGLWPAQQSMGKEDLAALQASIGPSPEAALHNGKARGLVFTRVFIHPGNNFY